MSHVGRVEIALLFGLAWTLSGCEAPPTRPTPLTTTPAATAPAPVDAEPHLQGLVTAAGIPSMSAGIAGARVDVVSGTGTGLSVTTGDGGLYWLAGASGTVSIRVTADGYAPTVVPSTISGDTTLNIGLEPVGPSLSLAGAYTLTVSAAGDCPASGQINGLADDLRTRRYATTIAQSGHRLDVKLSGAQFALHADYDDWGEPIVRGDGFRGYVTGNRVTFFLSGSDDPNFGSYPDLNEIVDGRNHLVIRGVVSGEAAERITGTLSGDLISWANAGPELSCRSQRHAFVLTR